MMVDRKKQETILLELRDISLEDCDRIPGGVDLNFVVDTLSPNTAAVNRLKNQLANLQPGPEISADDVTPVTYVPGHPGATPRRRSARISHIIRPVPPSFRTNVVPLTTTANNKSANKSAKKDSHLPPQQPQLSKQPPKPIQPPQQAPVQQLNNNLAHSTTNQSNKPITATYARRARLPPYRSSGLTQVHTDITTRQAHALHTTLPSEPLNAISSTSNAPSTSSFQPLDMHIDIPHKLPDSKSKTWPNSNKNYPITNQPATNSINDSLPETTHKETTQPANYSRFPTNVPKAPLIRKPIIPMNLAHNRPNPAIFNPKPILPYRPQIVDTSCLMNPSFVPRAQPVNTALNDFIRLAQNLIPGIDSLDLISKITSNPQAPINIPVPMGVDAASAETQLQNALRMVMQQNFLSQNNNKNYMQNNMGMNNNLGAQQYPNQLPQTSQMQSQFQQATQYFDAANKFGNNLMNPNNVVYPPYGPGPSIYQPNGPHMGPPNMSTAPKPAPPPKPPSEDEIAKQDGDAGEPDDDGFQEVETYADYMPAKLDIGKPHPDPIVETSSLSTVEPPDITYNLKMPEKVIERGYLSALQLETVIYASQQHEKFLPDGQTRKGFLIGDGAGVGKGRQIAGIICENFLNQRRKSIWLSVSTDLKLDAERDLKDIGAKIPVFALTKFPYGKRIDVETGVIFTTYSGLVSKSQSYRGQMGTRLGQLINWAGSKFEGVIVFDECHKAKNISVSKVKKNQSKAAEFVLELQNKLPRARIVYASATGASETKHLGYMMRLGIWGMGTPYANFSDFCESIDKGGVGAMELVAVDLKMRGAYMARQLSFKTTEFKIHPCDLSPEFKLLYDDCVGLWSKALGHFMKAADIFAGSKKNLRSMWATFWAAHQRFFKYLCIAAKVDKVEEISKESIANNMCVVIGLQSTGEAKTMEALGNDGDISDFISTARATFESLIDNHFPAPEYSRRVRPSPSRTPTPSTSCTDNSTDDMADGKFKRQISEKEKKLRDLAKEKKAVTKSKSSRQIRLERRKQEMAARKQNGKASGSSSKSSSVKKKRIMLESSSDTENSNTIAKFSPDEDSASSTSTLKELASDDESFIVSDESLEASSSSTAVSSDEDTKTDVDDDDASSSKTEISDKKIPLPTPRSGKKRELDTDSDSDVQITAVKKRQPAEIIFLSSDSEDEIESHNDRDDEEDPMKTHGKQLADMRAELYNMIDDLGPKLPNNTLDDLINRLGGPSKVAEMTGRKGHIVKDAMGQVIYKNRNDFEAREDLNIKEKERFMNGEKLIAIISEAASSGISLQADKRVKNTRRRVHITIELPWSADRAIQQFGRTHRSNQISGPKYVFVITDLAGEKRFASIVAKRLESLGALTHGDRKANSEGRDLSQFNITGRYCKQALEHLCRYIEYDHGFSNIKPVYPKDKDFIKDARQAFLDSGLGRKSSYNGMTCEPQAQQVNHFLNRLLGMRVDIQNAVFEFFTAIMDRLILHNKVRGEHDSGILELNYESGDLQMLPPEDYALETSAGKVKCSLRTVLVERGISWEKSQTCLKEAHDAENSDSRNGYYMQKAFNSDRYVVSLIIREKDKTDLFRCYKPNTGRALKPEFWSLIKDKWERCKEIKAKEIWDRVYQATDKQCCHMCFFDHCKRKEAKMRCDIGLRHRVYCILSGGTLTAWPYLGKTCTELSKKLKIVRLKMDQNNRVIGKLISNIISYHEIIID